MQCCCIFFKIRDVAYSLRFGKQKKSFAPLLLRLPLLTVVAGGEARGRRGLSRSRKLELETCELELPRVGVLK